MGIDAIPVRAQITIGTSLNIKTPYVIKFDVTKVRGQISTFSASVKVHGDSIGSKLSGQVIKIYAGTKSNYATNCIFSGIVKTINLSPCWDDPSYVFMNLTGEDILSILRGKKYTRRSTASLASWISIEGVTRRGLRSGKFKAKAAENIDIISSDTQHEGPVDATAVSNTKTLAHIAKTGEDPVSPEPAHSYVGSGGS